MICLITPFICLYIQTHGYLFYILHYNVILLYFAAQIAQALAIGKFQFVPVSLSHTSPCPPSFCVGLGFLFIYNIFSTFFLVLQDSTNSSCKLPATVLESATSPKSPDTFHWRILEAMISALLLQGYYCF